MKITGVDSILVALPYEHGAPKPARHSFGFWETQDVLLVRVEGAGRSGLGVEIDLTVVEKYRVS